jgi:hypothetical protein
MSVYTPPSRESIYQAIFAIAAATQINSAPAFKTTSRKWSPTRFAGEEKPALYQIQIDEEFKEAMGSKLPYVDKMLVEFYIVVNEPDTEIATTTLLNPLIDAVIASLWPPVITVSSNPQTLGGLVQDVRIAGKVDYREGLLGPNAFAVIPVRILTGGLQPGF